MTGIIAITSCPPLPQSLQVRCCCHLPPLLTAAATLPSLLLPQPGHLPLITANGANIYCSSLAALTLCCSEPECCRREMARSVSVVSHGNKTPPTLAVLGSVCMYSACPALSQPGWPCLTRDPQADQANGNPLPPWEPGAAPSRCNFNKGNRDG